MKKVAKLGTRGLLNRILGQPDLVSTIQNLPPRVLGKLIARIGLEDAGEIVALSTTEQLKKIFDEDLWRSTKPGEEEKFDAERFGLWLEIMFEMGPAFVAEKLAEMNEDFLTLAFSRQVLVINTQELAEDLLWADSTFVEKALESSLNHDFEDYCVISRDPMTWDSVFSALVALDTDHHDLLMNLLARCCFVSSEFIDDNGGLYEVLTSEEQLASDVAFDREQRREREGFVSPQTAAAFLALARGAITNEDHLTPAYFRNFETESVRKSNERPHHRPDMDRFHELLREAEVLAPEQDRLLLTGKTENGTTKHNMFRETLSGLHQTDEPLFSERMRQLSYLANVLVAGCTFQNRSLRPAEAAEAALAACNLGLETVNTGKSGNPATLMKAHDAVHFFRVGWNRIFEQVITSSARTLAATILKAKDDRDPWITEQLRGVSTSLLKALDAGCPWRCLEQLDALEIVLEQTLVQDIKGLIDECATFHGEFISTRKQLLEIKAFESTISHSFCSSEQR
ncbi:MAG TPA: DUF6178 family protein [Bdellovibrionota bacterium]|nr:DUF6178 family protein [Bdellovibrionota bacterium]